MASSRQCMRSGAALQQAKRYIQDIAITRTGKPIIRVQGGSSPTIIGHTATVFGATGFLGRYIVQRLAQTGCTVVVPFRDDMGKRHLKVSGDLGRVVFIEMDLRNTASIEESVRHSDIVYNLIGRDYPTKNFDLEDVNVEGVERIAEAVAKYDVDRFVQVSSYNADENSESEFFRTKARGEKVARSIFPETTIVRPSPIYGWQDGLLTKLAYPNRHITSNHMQQTFWPVHASDVGKALEKMCYDDTTAEQTYELHGPSEWSMAELAQLVDGETLRERSNINIPRRIREPLGYVMNKYLWWPTLHKDAVVREFIDQHIDPKAKTFKDLDMEPAEIRQWSYEYLKGYRSSRMMDLPPMTERELQAEKQYDHVRRSY
ncbi:NAD(P)-binding protein [Pseudovirgaria hyperparasitica]|uniref:NAD(P)-binding protein n=1 Tax=Pseudovirgaria hyperparasitica TaxID=470096 RepID=A0A6A6W5Q1_9PEZI|nr:NAD(P)-binding protein [Pseudovirgaria hyperparasitica]KAF2758258.1 NAD(P)-binding protein [Pseudovirgaria hyperparasitica]